MGRKLSFMVPMMWTGVEPTPTQLPTEAAGYGVGLGRAESGSKPRAQRGLPLRQHLEALVVDLLAALRSCGLSRTVLSVGFERIDASAMAVKGPDDANVVWIGRRYRSRAEAEAVAAALEVRLQDAGRSSDGLLRVGGGASLQR